MAALTTGAARAGGKPDGALGGQGIKDYFAKTRIYGTTPARAALGTRLSALGHQPSAISHQPSAISHQLLAFSF